MHGAFESADVASAKCNLACHVGAFRNEEAEDWLDLHVSRHLSKEVELWIHSQTIKAQTQNAVKPEVTKRLSGHL
jgi:hypothetical protein